MGEIDIFAELKKDNKASREVDLRVLADAMRIYAEASANIKANGAICVHPRTGAPIKNPYLDVLDKQGAVISRMKYAKADRVMSLLVGDGR